MYTSYKLNTKELNDNIIESIKKVFKNKDIEIIVHEIIDETDYLLNNDANKIFLLNAINDLEKDKNFINVDIK